MIEGLKPYAKYKESGHCSLGRVPCSWSLLPLRRVATPKSECGRTDLELLSVYLHRGVIRYSESGGQVHKPSTDLTKYQVVEPGDFVLNNQQAWRGSIGVSKYQGIISPAYVVMKLSLSIAPDYANYLFRSTAMVAQYVVASRGVGDIQRNIYYPDLRGSTVVVPPPEEQAAIVRFLDHANRKIDGFIRAKRKLIGLLNEQKQAIIHRAVTRGLDPNIPLKPSGIPWLGDIPKHWEVRRVASFAHKVTNGWVGPTREILRESGVPYLQSLHVKEGEIRFRKKYFVDESWLSKREKIRLRAGDVVVVQTGDVGQVAHIPEEFHGAGCHALIIVATNLSVISGSYLSQVLNCWYGQIALKLIETGALLPHLNCGYVRDVAVPVPPLLEQQQIEQSLRGELQPISDTIARLVREIELLREYQTRLVADVVTGKLDVRPAARHLAAEPLASAPAPDESPEPEDSEV